MSLGADRRVRPAIASTDLERILFSWAEHLSSAPGNVDRFAHISQTFSDNAAPPQILTALD